MPPKHAICDRQGPVVWMLDNAIHQAPVVQSKAGPIIESNG